MPLLIICEMSELLICRYCLKPSLFVWPMSFSEMIPHDRLIILLSSWEGSTRPFGLSIKIPLVIINHKVSITLNDKRVLVTTRGPCVRSPHCLTVFAVHYQIPISLHDKLFRPSLCDERLSYPKVVNKSILMFLQDQISIALESQLVSTTRMTDASITSINDFLIPVVWILLQICHQMILASSKLI